MNLKHNLLSATAAVLLATGAANAQIVVRIGPPPPRRSKSFPLRPARIVTGSGSAATTAGTAIAMSGLAAATCVPRIAGAVWVAG